MSLKSLRSSGFLLSASLSLLGLAWAPPAAAADCTTKGVPLDGSYQEDAQESRWVQESVDLRMARRDTEAANLLQRAYELRRDPSVLARQALAEAAALDWPLAYEHLTCALSVSHPWFETIAEDGGTRRQQLKGFLENRIVPELGWLELQVAQAGVTVRVGTRVRGVTPLDGPLAVTPGRVSVSFELPRHKVEPREVQIDKGKRSTLTLALQLLPGRLLLTVLPQGALVSIDGTAVGKAPITAPVTVAPGKHLVRVELEGFQPEVQEVRVEAAEGADLRFALKQVSRDQRPPRAPDSERNPLWLVLAGGGALISASSIIPWTMADTKTSELENDCAASTREGCDYDDRRSSIESLDAVSNVLLYGGASLAVAGVAAWLIDESPPKESSRRAAFAPVVTPGYGGVAYSQDF